METVLAIGGPGVYSPESRRLSPSLSESGNHTTTAVKHHPPRTAPCQETVCDLIPYTSGFQINQNAKTGSMMIINVQNTLTGQCAFASPQ